MGRPNVEKQLWTTSEILIIQYVPMYVVENVIWWLGVDGACRMPMGWNLVTLSVGNMTSVIMDVSTSPVPTQVSSKVD